MEAVIFDVDGTLAETERDGHRLAFNQAFERHGLPYRWSEEEYAGLLATTGGRGRLAGYLAGQGHDGDVDTLAGAIHRTKTELFVEWVVSGAGVQARDGAVELVEDLVAARVRLAVATTGRRRWVEPLLDRLFAGRPFEVVVTGDDVKKLKPDPELYATALDRLGVAAASALAIEDSPPGLAAAVAAGIACVVVASEYNRGEPFSGAVAVVQGYRSGVEPPRGRAGACLAGGVTAAALRCVHTSVSVAVGEVPR